VCQFISPTRTFPPVNSEFLAGPHYVTGGDGPAYPQWDSFELSDFSGVTDIPSPDFNGTLPTITCLLKANAKANQTKCGSNLRLTFQPQGHAGNTDSWLVDCDFEGTFDDGSLLRTKGRPTYSDITVTNLADGRFAITGGLDLDMEFSEDGQI